VTPKNEHHLLEKFPTIYPRLPINGGFQFGDGWFQLVLKLSARLEALSHSLAPDARFSVDEAKEKLGCLSLSYSVPDWSTIPKEIGMNMLAIQREAWEDSKAINEETGQLENF